MQRGPALLTLRDISTGTHGSRGRLDGLSIDLHGGEITGLAGVSGNGQAALAGLIAGTEKPVSGTIAISGTLASDWSPRAALAAGIGRIPEDRHAVGSIAAERYRSQRFSHSGFLDWNAARGFAETLIRDYDVKCPSPETRMRLLSGGNMQKLILGRALDSEPAIVLANQPARGLDVGAVSYVHQKLLEARARGAAVLLISEDLDEILSLSDRILVISNGRLSPPSARGERSARELGELMAGGFHDTAAETLARPHAS
jgi:simple sugar transport system ATP-binding protein